MMHVNDQGDVKNEQDRNFYLMLMIIKTFLGFYLIVIALSSVFLIIHVLTVMKEPLLAIHVALLNMTLLFLVVTLTAWKLDDNARLIDLMLVLASLYFMLTGFLALSGIMLLGVILARRLKLVKLTRFNQVGVALAILMVSAAHLYLAVIFNGFWQVHCYMMGQDAWYDIVFGLPTFYLTAIPEMQCSVIYSPTYQSFLAGFVVFFLASTYFFLRQFYPDTNEMRKRLVLNGVIMATTFIDGLGRLMFPLIVLNGGSFSPLRIYDLNYALFFLNSVRMYTLVVVGGALAFLELLLPLIYFLMMRLSKLSSQLEQAQ